ncbi:MAG: type I-E CRISPR-associated protein Cse2/CasB [Chloroflexi bacterium]|nr:type I-E CRISPR-associated protein Cse2/CasB [Chloroflexota bacterium]
MSAYDTQKHPFVSYLMARADDRAMLAALRRGLGAEPGDPETAGMFPYVVPWINEWYEEADIYMIASLFALHPDPAKGGNMGQHILALDPDLRKQKPEDRSKHPIERRFVQLLRMRRDSLEPRLRQQISILKSKEVRVNWHQLMRDVRYWDHPKRFVQREWARSFWRSNQSKST